MDVEKHSPGSIAHVSDMDFTAGEIPDEPGVHCSETQFACLSLGARSRDIFQNPTDLGGTEISVDDETGLFADEPCQVLRLQAVAIL